MAVRKPKRNRPRRARSAKRPRPKRPTAAKARRKPAKRTAARPRKAPAKATRRKAVAAKRQAASRRRRPAPKPRRQAALRRPIPAARKSAVAARGTGRRPAAPKPPRRAQAEANAATARSRVKTAPAAQPAPPAPVARQSKRRPAAPPDLGRTRRTLPDAERLVPLEALVIEPPGDDRQILSARAGRDELLQRLRLHTEAGPEITAGDLDAKWEDAYATGDEAPGGDNPTPDQDRVDEIGKALGVSYADDQELKGGEEITERDRHRWEFDPASSEDWPHDKTEK